VNRCFSVPELKSPSLLQLISVHKKALCAVLAFLPPSLIWLLGDRQRFHSAEAIYVHRHSLLAYHFNYLRHKALDGKTDRNGYEATDELPAEARIVSPWHRVRTGGRDVKLTTHLRLVLRWRMSGAVPPRYAPHNWVTQPAGLRVRYVTSHWSGAKITFE